MTSKNDTAPNADLWMTPPWATQLLLAEEDVPHLVLEPSFGLGHIGSELLRRDHDVCGIERDERYFQRGLRAMSLARTSGGRRVVGLQADWLTLAPERVQSFMQTLTGASAESWFAMKFGIVMNPPYSPATRMLAHVEKAFEMASVGCVSIAALLPLGFACSAARLAFWEAHPPTAVYPLVERPSFATGSGDGPGGSRDVCWYCWDFGNVTQAAPTRQVWKPLSRTRL